MMPHHTPYVRAAGLRSSTERVAQIRGEEDAELSRQERARELIAEAHPSLMEAMKELDSSEDRGRWVRLTEIVNELDDLDKAMAPEVGLGERRTHDG